MRFTQYATVIALAAVMPATSHAQFGGLIKKATSAAANRAEQKVVESKNLRPSSAFGPELTAESLDGVIRGLAAAAAKLQEADEFRTARQKLDAEYSKSIEAHDKERQAWEDKHSKIESCQDEARSKRRNDSQEAYEKRIQADPAAQAKMMEAAMKASQKMSAAQQKEDSAEVRRMMEDLAKSQGIDPKADSVAAIKQCGALPVKPAWLSTQESLRDQSQKLDGQVRDAENNAHSAGAKASGMAFKDYSLARERVLHWYIEARGGSKIQAFGGNERKLMEDRRADIEQHRGALGGA